MVFQVIVEVEVVSTQVIEAEVEIIIKITVEDLIITIISLKHGVELRFMEVHGKIII